MVLTEIRDSPPCLTGANRLGIPFVCSQCVDWSVLDRLRGWQALGAFCDALAARLVARCFQHSGIDLPAALRVLKTGLFEEPGAWVD